MADTQHTNETWKPIPGYEDLYQASDLGRIRSLDRMVQTVAGRTRKYKGQVLTQTSSSSGHLRVTLAHEGKNSVRLVHHLVLEAFEGPRPEGRVTRHLNDDPSDNRIENLAWGTVAENMADRVTNGVHHYSRRTHCANGHEYTPENTYRNPGRTYRQCRTCTRDRHRQKRRPQTSVTPS